MIPSLYEASATSFADLGMGLLTDVISCTVTMDKTSLYEMQMVYPLTGTLYSQLRHRRIIKVKPNQVDNPQPFRIYRIGKPINGKVTIYARHISYDLMGIPVTPFTATSAGNFPTQIAAHSVVSNPFSFETNIQSSNNLKVSAPASVRSLLSGGEETWQGFYGGELVFDGWTVKLRQAAGENRGVVIRYGHDMTDVNLDDNIASVYTGILPYYHDTQTDNVITGTAINAPGQYGYTKIMPVDVSTLVTADEPTAADVTSAGNEWLADNPVHEPEVHLSLSYAQIDQVVRLYDTISVYFEQLGISKTAKVSKTVYDALKERYVSVEVGDVKEGLSGDLTDASRLRKGILPLGRIREKSIPEHKMATGSGSSRVLQPKAVTTEKIDDEAVDTDQIAPKAVETDKIGDKAVDTGQIADDAVDAGQIAADAVRERNVKNKNISYDKFSTAVQNLLADIIEANAVFAGFVKVEGVLQCSSIIVNGVQMTTRTAGSLGNAEWVVAQITGN